MCTCTVNLWITHTSTDNSSCSPGIFFTDLGEEEGGDGGGEGEK